jgi:hypothetical protein
MQTCGQMCLQHHMPAPGLTRSSQQHKQQLGRGGLTRRKIIKYGKCLHARPVAVVRAVPEQTQQQQQQQQQQDLSPVEPEQAQSHRQFVSSDALTTMQEEQEAQLKALTSDMALKEQRFEWLAFWVGAAVAFGAGIW